MRDLRVIVCVLASSLGCTSGRTASDEDCAALGDKYVELFMAEQTDDTRELGPEVLEAAAANGREEIIEQCKTKSTAKATVKRCLEVTSLAAFREC